MRRYYGGLLAVVLAVFTGGPVGAADALPVPAHTDPLPAEPDDTVRGSSPARAADPLRSYPRPVVDGPATARPAARHLDPPSGPAVRRHLLLCVWRE